MTNKNVIWKPSEDFLQNSNIALLMKTEYLIIMFKKSAKVHVHAKGVRRP